MRISVLLVLFVVGRAQAETVGNFDRDRLIALYSDALTFIAPRILEPVPVPALTIWGLQGLPATDPTLRVVTSDTRLQLFRQSEVVRLVLSNDASPAPSALSPTHLRLAPGRENRSFQERPSSNARCDRGRYTESLHSCTASSVCFPPIAGRLRHSNDRFWKTALFG